MGKILTIFTPTYNRANTIGKLYNSLLKQSNKNFTWMIIDDGSTDNTKSLIDCFIKEKKIEIIYKHIENSGKMAAHNLAVLSAKTPLFLCVDSDDYLELNAVDVIINKYRFIKDDIKVVGIVAYKKIINDNFKYGKFPDNFVFSSLSNLYRKGFIGDTTLIFKTSIIKKYLFPKVSGEKFITEAYVYEQIDRVYKYLIVREFLTICEYMADGYTKNSKKIREANPTSFAMYYEQSARFSYNPLEILKKYTYALSFNKMAKSKIIFRFNIRLIFVPIAILFRKKILNKIYYGN